MENYVDTVQKKIGLMVSILGMLMVLINFLDGIIQNEGFLKSISYPAVWLVFIVVIPFIISVFVENKFFKILQVVGFIFVGVCNIMDDGYDRFYGPALFFASWMLMRQYGYFENKGKLKNILLMLMLIISSQISAFINISKRQGIYSGFSTLVFTLFLAAIMLIVWSDILRQQAMLKKENRSLKIDYNRLSEQVAEVENEQKPYNLKAVKITPAEKRVIEILTVYKASNREISERLNIAESTVKLHLYNIYNKIGVDNRFAVIDLCKYNFK